MTFPFVVNVTMMNKWYISDVSVLMPFVDPSVNMNLTRNLVAYFVMKIPTMFVRAFVFVVWLKSE